MPLKKILQNILGELNYQKLERVKKFIFPTLYDKEQQKYFKNQVEFYSHFIKPNDLCFDIGGNVGLKSKIFLQLGARVVTVEPQASCVAILKKEIGDKATIVAKGIGGVNEVKDFYISNNTQLSSFASDWVDNLKEDRFKGSDITKVEKIEIVTLDSLIKEYGNPDFVKIDVEGFELEVLKGLTGKFNFLSFEYAVPEKLQNVVDCLNCINDKYQNLTCNYAAGHNSNFVLPEWITIHFFLEIINKPEFINSYAGDIYIQTNA